MKKVILAAAAIAVLVVPSVAPAAQLVRVNDPTPTKSFSSSSYSGYVAVYSDGAEVCNANTAIPNPRERDNPNGLTGYVWVGPSHTADDPAVAAPGNVAGAGNNWAEDNPDTQEDESHGPCDE